MGDPERPSDRASRCLEAVIEDPAGSMVRHVYDPVIGQWRTYRHPAAVSPWPANYGYLPGTYNPSDDDALDVIVLSQDPLPTGTRLLVRPVGLLRRADGDDKILAVACDDPAYGAVQRLSEVPVDAIERILRWFTEWETAPEIADEEAAWVAIHAARRS